MGEFCNPVNDRLYQHEEKEKKNTNIDIIDFQTVSFDKDQDRAKRSLSLNIYKYEQMLGPMEYVNGSLESFNGTETRKKDDTPPNKQSHTKAPHFISSIGTAISFSACVLVIVVMIFVIENKTEGKLLLINIRDFPFNYIRLMIRDAKHSSSYYF